MVSINGNNYTLHIQRTIGAVQGADTINFYFAVCEVGKKYPSGYVCNLPKNYDDVLNAHSKHEPKSFKEIFSDVDRIKFALDLLKEASTNPLYGDNLEIKTEIENRISVINRQTLLAKRKIRRGFYNQKIFIQGNGESN
jgi:hypothetical protein